MLYGRLRTLLGPRQSDIDNKRTRNRVKTVLLHCELGEVADISATGMRVRSKRVPALQRDPAWFVLRADDMSIPVMARPVWAQKCRGGHEIGLTFVNLTPEQTAAISRLARDCADTETLRPPE